MDSSAISPTVLVVAFVIGLAGLWLVPAIVWTAVLHFRFHAYHRRTGKAYPPLGVRGWVRLYIQTAISILRICWWSVRALVSDGLRVPRGEVSGVPVLCVHGFHMKGSCMWGIRRTLERRGRSTRAVSLGAPYRAPEVYAASLARALNALLPDSGGKVDVVAHSMGGLVVRLALAQDPALAVSIRRVVTLGAPHHGTALLRWLRFGPVYDMMGREVEFLQKLPPLSESAPEIQATTIATVHDFVVYPVETAHMKGARQITLERVGHTSLVSHRRVIELVADLLCED